MSNTKIITLGAIIALAIVIGTLVVDLLSGCTPESRIPLYGPGLVTCNQMAKTCEESIRCENELRLANNRPLRDVDAGCR